MKQFFSLFLIAISLQTCTPLLNSANGQPININIEKNESGKYNLQVSGAQFENFILTEARPKLRYTEQYLKSKNTFLVQEWNTFYHSRSYPTVIESLIDYNPSEKYGLEFEYKLYQVFAMVNSQYGIPFNNLGQMDK